MATPDCPLRIEGFGSHASAEWAHPGRWGTGGHGRQRGPWRSQRGGLWGISMETRLLCPSRVCRNPIWSRIGQPVRLGAWACPQGLCATAPEASAQGLASSLACSLVSDSRGRESRLWLMLSLFTSLAATQNVCGDLQMPSAQRKPVPKAAPGSRRPHGE